MWNRRVCVGGSLENLNLRKLKVENTLGKVTEKQPVWKKVLVSIGSNTFFAIKYWKFAKKVLDPILTNTFFFMRESRSRGNRSIVGRRGKVFMDWHFGNYKVGWKVRLSWQQRKLVASGKIKNGGGERPIDGF